MSRAQAREEEVLEEGDECGSFKPISALEVHLPLIRGLTSSSLPESVPQK